MADKMLFLMQDDPYKLWPAVIIAFIMVIIRITVNNTFYSFATRMTQYKIDIAKPDWLTTPSLASHKNGINKACENRKTKELTESQSKQMLKLIDKLKEKDVSKLCSYAQDIELPDHQIRELKSYFITLKQADTHNNKFLESAFKFLCILPISFYGTYVVYFKHDFFINHHKQWTHVGDKHPITTECVVYHDNEPLTQVYDDAMLWYYIISLGISYFALCVPNSVGFFGIFSFFP